VNAPRVKFFRSNIVRVQTPIALASLVGDTFLIHRQSFNANTSSACFFILLADLGIGKL
jgi:hypothetical protein